MSSLLSVITAVLNDDGIILDLPESDLIAIQNQGQPIPGSVSGKLILRIARLQTLIIKEQERAEIPEDGTLKQVCAQGGGDYLGVLASSLSVQEDATSNAMMIERLIVASVREEFPRECERFGVRYVVDASGRICWSEVRQQRFLD